MNPPDPFSSQSRITPEHLNRLAYIYVRQSSPKQVKHNRESQAYQYQLSERAIAFGWRKERLRIVDADQGRSAREVKHREGYKGMFYEVSLGHVGIIFSYEVSRISRNNSDWYALLDLAAIFGTLIADFDGLYDPRLFNDRLILGLKGTMGEAEIHFQKLRLHEGRKKKASRGEFCQRLPTGLIRLPDKSVIKHPDKEVRRTIQLVLDKFQEMGSCWKVVCYLQQNKIKLPRIQYQGLRLGELAWKPPTREAVYDMIINPAYAGAFAYGRRQNSDLSAQSGRRASHRKPISDWQYLLKDIYPAYITWEQWEANIAKLNQASTRWNERIKSSAGTARNGAALLQGLAICAICGDRMKVTYNPHARYFCNKQVKEYGIRKYCPTIPSASVDETVTQAFFEAIRPAQINALENILAKQTFERDRLIKHWERRLERLRYDVRRAEQQYDSVDATNRLVAAMLERRWEERLHELHAAEEDYRRFQIEPLPTDKLKPALKHQLQNISDTLPALWKDKQLSHYQKKELLRCLISHVVMERKLDHILIRVVWMSTGYSEFKAVATSFKFTQMSNHKQLIYRIKMLWKQGKNDKEIAVQLTKEGYHSTRANIFLPTTVLRIRYSYGWRSVLSTRRNNSSPKGYLSAKELSESTDTSIYNVYYWLQHGEIDSKYILRPQKGRRVFIKDDQRLIRRLKKMVSKR